jgi:SAM-dependent methyltransferase
VTTSHLNLLHDLLAGVAGVSQEPLFLWAYDFSVVPTSLVSSMYELFYRQEVDDPETGTYYTPPELVEYVLADLLRAEILDRAPRVLDPACGSGIFLVEAYGRIVRHEAAQASERLSSERLRHLLLNRIAGCDINESAIQLAAFSLYIAFLNYQTPQDIRRAGPLPPLISRGIDAPAPLLVGDAFSPTADETENPPNPATLPWPRNSFDVIVGNPPWSEPRGQSRSLGEQWAKRNHLTIGDRSPSQLFLWRSLHLLADDGVATLLVSAKVLFNLRTKSRVFRREWLTAARVDRVVNFSPVRRDFFERAISPFALVRFRHAGESPDGPVIYETARPVPRARRGSTALARLDRRVVDQRALRDNDHLWKTYSAGTHRDEALIARLGLDGQLRNLIPKPPSSWFGYQRARPDTPEARETPSEWRELRSLATFESWGPLAEAWFEPLPTHVKRVPDERLLRGPRLLVRRGVSGDFGVHARFVTEPLAFRHTVYGFPIEPDSEWAAKVALGTLLSALGRYWLYMVSGSWGSRNDDVRVDELLDLPLRLEEAHPATARILAAVESLPDTTLRNPQLSHEQSLPDVAPVLAAIDEAVSDLFELTPSERDLVDDFWASMSARATDRTAVSCQPSEDQLARYLDVFDNAWRPVLGDDAELDRHLWQDAQAQVIAAVFETRYPGEQPAEQREDHDAWSNVLARYDPDYRETPAGTLLSYGTLRAVTDSAIVIVKRNECRLWSATAAREDAEATIVQAMRLQRA